MRPSDKCPEEATRGRHLFPASVTIKAECRGFTRLRHRQNTAPSSPPLPLPCLTMRGVVVIFHRGFQGCGIRLLSSFPHITAAHPFVGCPASTCPATRHIVDGECEGDEEDGSGLVGSSNGSVSILGNVGSDVFIPPTPPSSPTSLV